MLKAMFLPCRAEAPLTEVKAARTKISTQIKIPTFFKNNQVKKKRKKEKKEGI